MAKADYERCEGCGKALPPSRAGFLFCVKCEADLGRDEDDLFDAGLTASDIIGGES